MKKDIQDLKNIKTVVCDYQTELIAKRRALNEAMIYWDKNESDYFIKAQISYYPYTSDLQEKEEVIIRREVISQFLGVECLWYWRNKGGVFDLHKLEFLDLWEFLKMHQDPNEKGVIAKIKNFFKRRK